MEQNEFKNMENRAIDKIYKSQFRKQIISRMPCIVCINTYVVYRLGWEENDQYILHYDQNSQ